MLFSLSTIRVSSTPAAGTERSSDWTIATERQRCHLDSWMNRRHVSSSHCSYCYPCQKLFTPSSLVSPPTTPFQRCYHPNSTGQPSSLKHPSAPHTWSLSATNNPRGPPLCRSTWTSQLPISIPRLQLGLREVSSGHRKRFLIC
jgi:hypothetical protein